MLVLSVRIPNKTPMVKDRVSAKFDILAYKMNGGSLSKTDLQKQFDFRKIEEHLDDKSYLKICDFDEHFENWENDWTNKWV